MKHLSNDNLALVSARTNKTNEVSHFFITQNLSKMKTWERSNGSYHFPLYLYPDSDQQTLGGNSDRKPNLDPKIVQEIADKLGLKFTAEPSSEESSERKSDGTSAPVDLLEHPVVDEFSTTYPVDGDNTITHRLTKTDPGFVKEQQDDETGKVWINDQQYFGNVPETAWEFYIGGYQPAQKWLKDRRDRTLDYEDIAHYQKIIVALKETDRVMREINEIEVE